MERCPEDVASVLRDLGIGSHFHSLIADLVGGEVQYLVDLQMQDLQGRFDDQGRKIPGPVARGIARQLKEVTSVQPGIAEPVAVCPDSGAMDAGDEPETWRCAGPEPAIVGVTFEGVPSDGSSLTTEKFLDLMAKRLEVLGVKQEPHDEIAAAAPKPYEAKLKLDEVLQTHDSVSKCFRDRRSFEELIADLDNGRVDPLKDEFLKLDVFHWPGEGYYSVRNRRLMCLKRHQENVRRTSPDHHVWIRATVWTLPESFVDVIQSDPMYDKFVRSYSTRDHGRSIRVRGKRRNVEVFWWPPAADDPAPGSAGREADDVAQPAPSSQRFVMPPWRKLGRPLQSPLLAQDDQQCHEDHAKGRSRSRSRGPWTMCVDNLPSDMTLDELRQTAADFGQVVAVKISRWHVNKNTGRKGIVEYCSSGDMRRAVQKLDNRRVEGWERWLHAYINVPFLGASDSVSVG